MKANHNVAMYETDEDGTVFYGSKILKWKQITTVTALVTTSDELFSMVQRY